MKCKKCGKSMVEQKRSFHKKRKWICPVCGRAKMEPGRYKRSERNKGDKNKLS